MKLVIDKFQINNVIVINVRTLNSFSFNPIVNLFFQPVEVQFDLILQ